MSSNRKQTRHTEKPVAFSKGPALAAWRSLAVCSLLGNRKTGRLAQSPARSTPMGGAHCLSARCYLLGVRVVPLIDTRVQMRRIGCKGRVQHQIRFRPTPAVAHDKKQTFHHINLSFVSATELPRLRAAVAVAGREIR